MKRTTIPGLFTSILLLFGMLLVPSCNRMKSEPIISNQDLIEIQPGSFTRSNPPKDRYQPDVHENHQVIISRAFLISATEITRQQWSKVMKDDPSSFAECSPDCPVETVTWPEAIEFCNRLSKEEGLDPCYSGEGDEVQWDRSCTGYRLPTEAEWEYAAYASTTTPYYTGDCLSSDDSNHDGTHPPDGCPKGEFRQKLMPVKSFPPNPWGLYDMYGNVNEWCWDWILPYADRDMTDPSTDNPPTQGRVVRGGSWRSFGRHCSSEHRFSTAPNFKNSTVGFRVVRAIN